MFNIQKWTVNSDTNSIDFRFECESYGRFCETITFPEKADISKYTHDQKFHSLLDIAAAYLGVSYYKLSVDKEINFPLSLSEAVKNSIEKLYTCGLGEFYIRNDLQYPPKIKFHYLDGSQKKSCALDEEELKSITSIGVTVAFGGGKDSHVSISLLKKLGIEQDLVSVVLADSVQNTLQKLSNKNITFIQRKIDPKLISLVKEGRGYNGHIPITAINSIILSVYSYLVGNNWVVFSNERGASVPTMHHGEHEINHQYSKSLEFESLFRVALNDICGGKLQYFSMLRPFSELWIAAYLGTETVSAHEYFSSCNKNFVFEGKDKLAAEKRWCGECSKCVYTAIILAPHVSKQEFLNIFGTNILNKDINTQVAKDLCGIGVRKPWECVGDFADTAASLSRLSSSEEWAQDIIPSALVMELHEAYGEDYLKERFTSEPLSRGEHFLPEKLLSIVSSS